MRLALASFTKTPKREVFRFINLADFLTRNNYFDRRQLFLGLDLGKKTSQLCILSPNGTELANFSFSTTRENLVALAKALRKQDHIAITGDNHERPYSVRASALLARLSCRNPHE